MEQDTLYLASFVSGDVSTPNNALGAPNGVFTTDGNENVSWTAEWAFETVTGLAQSVGTQTLTLRVRKGSNSGNPSVTSVRIRQGGDYVTANLLSSSQTISSTSGVDLPVEFSGSVLDGVSGASVEIVTVSATGGPAARNAVEIDAATWELEYFVPVVLDGEASLSGSGSVSSDGVVRPTALAEIDGFGSVSADAELFVPTPRDTEASERRVTEAGVERLTFELMPKPDASETYFGASDLPGVSVLSASAIRKLVAAAAIAGSGTLAAAATVEKDAAADLTGAGALTSAAAIQKVGAASVSGSGGIAAEASIIRSASASPSAQGSIDAEGTLLKLAEAGLLGSGVIAVNGTVFSVSGGQADLSGIGSLLAIPQMTLEGAGALGGVGSLEASGIVGGEAVATLEATGSVEAEAVITLQGHAALEATGSKLAAATKQKFAIAGLSGSGSLNAEGEIKAALSGLASMAGVSQVEAEGAMSMFASASLSGTSTVSASGFMGALERGVFVKRPEDGDWVPASLFAYQLVGRETENGVPRYSEAGVLRLDEGEWKDVARAWAFKHGQWQQFYGDDL